MKKLVIVIVLLALAVLLVPVATAQGSVVASVSPTRQTVRVGEQFVAAVVLDSGDVAVGAYTAEVYYDPRLLRLVAVSGPPAGCVGVVNDTRPGRIRFNGANVDGTTGQTVLLAATFQAKRRGWASLDLAVETMAEAETFQSLLPVEASDGVVTIWPQFFWWRR